jgi:D-arabinitol 2-dehydrogenase
MRVFALAKATISPGYTLTALSKAVLDTNPILRDEWLHRIPMVIG